jgi:uncharacterized protein (TIGR02246 family)
VRAAEVREIKSTEVQRSSANPVRSYDHYSVVPRKENTLKVVTVSLAALIFLSLADLAFAQTPSKEKQLRQAVQSFYDAFNAHGFGRASEYTTEDWNHINPFGGRTRGRKAVLKELNEVHSTFLKGVSDIIENMDVRFATPDVAVVTVSSRMSTYTTPDGVKRENELHIRTFVVVRRSGRWLIMQDQNTLVGR